MLFVGRWRAILPSGRNGLFGQTGRPSPSQFARRVRLTGEGRGCQPLHRLRFALQAQAAASAWPAPSFRPLRACWPVMAPQYADEHSPRSRSSGRIVAMAYVAARLCRPCLGLGPPRFPSRNRAYCRFAFAGKYSRESTGWTAMLLAAVRGACGWAAPHRPFFVGAANGQVPAPAPSRTIRFFALGRSSGLAFSIQNGQKMGCSLDRRRRTAMRKRPEDSPLGPALAGASARRRCLHSSGRPRRIPAVSLAAARPSSRFALPRNVQRGCPRERGPGGGGSAQTSWLSAFRRPSSSPQTITASAGGLTAFYGRGFVKPPKLARRRELSGEKKCHGWMVIIWGRPERVPAGTFPRTERRRALRPSSFLRGAFLRPGPSAGFHCWKVVAYIAVASDDARLAS